MDSGVIFTPGHFDKARVTWEDVAQKFQHDNATNNPESIEIYSPNMVKMDSSYLPSSKT